MLSSFASVASASDPTPTDRLFEFLNDYAKFDKYELSEVKSGEVVTKVLDSDVKHEVVVLSVVRVDAPRKTFLDNYGRKVSLIETQGVLNYGMLSDPPTLDDVEEFALDPRDMGVLKDCAAGSCNMKIPVQAMERYVNEIDWSEPGAEDKANEMTREMLIGYAKAYLEGGNAQLVEYHDQETPVPLVEQFRGLLEQSPHLFKYRPEFYTYLEKFPEASLRGVRNYLFWAKEDVGANYTISSLNHITAVIPDDPALGPMLASKQIYANHYFEAGLGLTTIVIDTEASSPAFYLAYLNRSRVGALRRSGWTTKIVRKKLKDGMGDLMNKRLLAVKTQVEALSE